MVKAGKNLGTIRKIMAVHCRRLNRYPGIGYSFTNFYGPVRSTKGPEATGRRFEPQCRIYFFLHFILEIRTKSMYFRKKMDLRSNFFS